MGENSFAPYYSDGAEWREVGGGSTSGGGVSNSGAESLYPVLAIARGFVCVAWNEVPATSVEVRCAAE